MWRRPLGPIRFGFRGGSRPSLGSRLAPRGDPGWPPHSPTLINGDQGRPSHPLPTTSTARPQPAKVRARPAAASSSLGGPASKPGLDRRPWAREHVFTRRPRLPSPRGTTPPPPPVSLAQADPAQAAAKSHARLSWWRSACDRDLRVDRPEGGRESPSRPSNVTCRDESPNSARSGRKAEVDGPRPHPRACPMIWNDPSMTWPETNSPPASPSGPEPCAPPEPLP